MRSIVIFALILSVVISGAKMADSMSFFDTNFVELDATKMVSTSDSNYALSAATFPNNWRAVSVNGDEVIIATRDNQYIVKKYHGLSADEKNALEGVKAPLTNIIRSGPFNARSTTGLAKLTTFDKNGGTSSMGTGGGGSSSSASSSASGSSSGGMSISRTGPNTYIVTKSSFPFKWQRVFVNEDLTTIVYKDGRVVTLPLDLVRGDEKAKLIALRQEVDKSSKAAENMVTNMTRSFKSPMDFVNRAFGGIFGR